MKLISWNVAGWTRRTRAQAQAVLAERPDVLVLQEITRSSAADWKQLLSEGWHRLEHLVDGTDLVETERQYTELIASRHPLTRIDTHGFEVQSPSACSRPESTRPPAQSRSTRPHVPPGVSNGWGKIEHLEAIYRRLAQPSDSPRTLCGDFNTPRDERDDGTVITWAQDEHTGAYNERPERWFRKLKHPEPWDPERWDTGERNVLEGLAEYDLTDVFRLLDRFPQDEKSWYWQGRIGRRFDPVFASQLLRPALHPPMARAAAKRSLRDRGGLRVRLTVTPA